MQIELSDHEAFSLKVVLHSINDMSSLLVVSMNSDISRKLIESAANDIREVCMLMEPIVSRIES